MTGDAPVREGDVLGGKFRVEQVLGAGGMGVVVAAQHLVLGQRVALKFLLPAACGSPDAVERFLREARAAVQIRSEHIAQVSDVGTLDNGAPYMVMEYLQGSDLSDVLRTRGALPASEAVDYLLQACEAVAQAHALGLVHRDLKPSNLFLTRRPDGSTLVKVLDFGISKVTSLGGAGTGGSTLTASASVMGSPMYMSPEQIRSAKNVDARTDIWSLGVILHELLTGRAVYESDTLPGILAAIVADAPAPLRSHWPEAPPELEQIILRCLERDLARRWQNVGALACALLPFAPVSARVSVERITRLVGGGAGTATVDAGAGPILSPAASTGSRADAASVRPSATMTASVGPWGATGDGVPRSRGGAVVVAVVVGLVAILGGGAWMLTHRPTSGTKVSATTAESSSGRLAPAPSAVETATTNLAPLAGSDTTTAANPTPAPPQAAGASSAIQAAGEAPSRKQPIPKSDARPGNHRSLPSSAQPSPLPTSSSGSGSKNADPNAAFDERR